MELIVYSRAACHLCEHMVQELAALTAGRSVVIRVVDVDRDAELRRRYGSRIPVLVAGGEEVCSGHLVPSRVRSLLDGIG